MTVPEPRFSDYLAEINAALGDALTRFGAAENRSRGSDAVLEVMRYAIENGGKRIRPILTLAFCELCGGDALSALPFACAAETIHSYSLIHDDLPCMDDDDMRRGKPAVHIQFGEDMAVLAGDALLTLAFELLLDADAPPERLVSAGKVLANAAGFCGMIAGQAMDMQNEGETVDLATLEMTDARKTGALIGAACELGCIAAGAADTYRSAALAFAKDLGLAFQIQDDILDVTADSATLGKPAGSDWMQDKSTYVSLLGLSDSRTQVQALTVRAKQALAVFGQDSAFLCALADALCSRAN